MKKLIRNILREELDPDWDFMDDVPEFFQQDQEIYFNPLPTNKEWDKLATLLNSEGWRWGSGKKLTNWSPMHVWRERRARTGSLLLHPQKQVYQSNGDVNKNDDLAINARDLI